MYNETVELTKLFNKVKSLRHWQRAWEEYHFKGDLQVIKKLGHEVDTLVKRINKHQSYDAKTKRKEGPG